MFQNVENDGGQIVNRQLARQLDSFARQWFSNIREQHYQKERMIVPIQSTELDVRFGADGKVAEILGDLDAAEAYARKIGLKFEDEAAAPSSAPQRSSVEQQSLFDVKPRQPAREPVVFAN